MESVEDRINRKVVRMVEKVYSGESDFNETYGDVKQMLEPFACDERGSVVSLSNYGAVLSDTGSHRKAIPFLKKAIGLGADFAQAYFNYGVALMNTSELKRGTEFIRKASEFKKRKDAIEAYFDPLAH